MDEVAKAVPIKRVPRKPKPGDPAAVSASAEQAGQAAKPEPGKPPVSVAPKRAERIKLAAAKPVGTKRPVIAVQPAAPAAAIVEAAPDRVGPLAETVAENIPTPTDTIEMIEAATSPATSSDPIAADMIAPTKEGLDPMATVSPTPSQTVGIASEKLQSMFGDVGARFKASFEKSSKLGEEMVDLAKGNVEAVVASARVAAKGSEALGQDAAEYSKKSLESAVAVMKSFASVKSPTELFQLQSDFAKASFDSAVAEASKFSESMMKLAGDVAQPLSTRYAVAAEKIKAVAI